MATDVRHVTREDFAVARALLIAASMRLWRAMDKEGDLLEELVEFDNACTTFARASALNAIKEESHEVRQAS
jgi:hypothetical protein